MPTVDGTALPPTYYWNERMRSAWVQGSVRVLLLCVCMGGAARADRFSALERATKDSSWRVRLQAASVLSKIKDPRSLELLERLLQDRQEAVRRAAQAALGALRQSPVAPVPKRGRPEATVQIGGVGAKAHSVRPQLTQQLRALLEREFRHTPSIAINGQYVTGYVVDGSITAVDRKLTRDMTEVTVEVSVIVERMPSKAMLMMTSGGATAQEPRGNASSVATLESDALEGAVKGAHENLLAYVKTH